MLEDNALVQGVHWNARAGCRAVVSAGYVETLVIEWLPLRYWVKCGDRVLLLL